MAKALYRRELGRWRKRFDLGSYLDEDALVNRIGLSETLEGHDGCVNTLKWNAGGTILASGSDDRQIILWLMDECGQCRLQTDHTANIFAVDFLPSSSDNIVLSAAGDNSVKLHEVTNPEATFTWTTSGRVKRLCTAADEPYLFWSAAEDGFIREYDARTYTERKLIKAAKWRQMETGVYEVEEARTQVKTMAVCQGRSELVAVGASHSIVAIYDRRGDTKKPVIKLANKDYTCHPYLAHATHVAFDYHGTECIVNQGNGAIYVYKLNEADDSPTSMQKLEECLRNEGPVEHFDYATLPRTTNRAQCQALLEEKKYSEAIELYSRNLPNVTDRMEKSIYYSNRGLCYLLRRWEGDTYACIRDCLEALLLYSGNAKALHHIGMALTNLEQWELATRVVLTFKRLFPENNSYKRIERHIKEIVPKDNDENLPLLRDVRGILDYYQRFVGHRNYQTDIKEANFFGSKNQYIVAGSDCGSLICWDRATGVVRGAWRADENIVNIVQPHPSLMMLATSGIDDEIRLWEPIGEDVEDERRVTDVWSHLHTEEPNRSRIGLQAMIRYIEENRVRIGGEGDEDRPECNIM